MMKRGKVTIIVVVILIIIVTIGFIMLKPKPQIPDDGNNLLVDAEEPVAKTMTAYEACLEQYEEIAGECIAYRTKDPSYCDSIPQPDLMNWCKARITKDKKYCDMLDVEFFDYHNCLIDVAQTEEDCRAIDYTNEPYEINECMAYVTQDPSYCDDTPEKDRLDCLSNIDGNATHCEENPVFERKWACLWIHSKETDICKQFQEAYCDEMLFDKDTLVYVDPHN
jgi:hypothetical protein